MSEQRKKLAALAGDRKSGWSDKSAIRARNKGWLVKSAKIGFRVLAALKKEGLTQKDLAERMNVSAQQINKIVKGQENLTLETISKLEESLQIKLFDIPHPEVSAEKHLTWVSPVIKINANPEVKATGGYCVLKEYTLKTEAYKVAVKTRFTVNGEKLLVSQQ